MHFVKNLLSMSLNLSKKLNILEAVLFTFSDKNATRMLALSQELFCKVSTFYFQSSRYTLLCNVAYSRTNQWCNVCFKTKNNVFDDCRCL